MVATTHIVGYYRSYDKATTLIVATIVATIVAATLILGYDWQILGYDGSFCTLPMIAVLVILGSSA